MALGVLVATAAGCGGTLEDDYRRQQQQRTPTTPTTVPQGVSAPAGATLPTTIPV